MLVYNYPSGEIAAANRNTVLISLTETPSTQATNQTWADLLTVDRVMTVENQVIVQAHTEAANFIGNAFNQRDFTGFLALPRDVPVEPTGQP